MIAALIIACVSVLAVLAATPRLIAGPGLHDRIAAALSAALRLSVFCAAYAIAAKMPRAIDVAIVIALATLIGQLTVLKFFKSRTFQTPLARDEAA